MKCAKRTGSVSDTWLVTTTQPPEAGRFSPPFQDRLVRIIRGRRNSVTHRAIAQPRRCFATPGSSPRQVTALSTTRAVSSRVARSRSMSPAPQPCTVIIPVKETTIAKSRLGSLGADARRELALAFACDVVIAAGHADVVRRVLVVTNDPVGRQLADLGADLVPDTPDAGLNPALSHAAAVAAADDPESVVAPMSADLPALRPSELDRALITGLGRWFVRDAHGHGTTLLAAAPGHPLAPAFGARSAAAHLSSGAREVVDDGLPTLRQDVDTETDLAVAQRLGVGPHTAEVLARISPARLA